MEPQNTNHTAAPQKTLTHEEVIHRYGVAQITPAQLDELSAAEVAKALKEGRCKALIAGEGHLLPEPEPSKDDNKDEDEA